ncbi:hypothetical protein SEA_ANGELA_261 [Streptomyces phage Angela]|nr:hypothetical protein SEA_ANGELA_4 [Streptomyces phage Angela]UVK61312.1 hypothetical protein SEA_ANGELA_261 [Streptomyces phage Angela]
MFELDESRILRIFNANGIKMSLNKAFTVAGYIYSAHVDRVTEVENNIWDMARKEANARVESAYDDGYKQGKEHGARLSDYNAEMEHTKMVACASIWAEGEFSYIDLQRKIRCIKHLRQRYSTMDLRTAKYIIESLSGNGVGVRW